MVRIGMRTMSTGNGVWKRAWRGTGFRRSVLALLSSVSVMASETLRVPAVDGVEVFTVHRRGSWLGWTSRAAVLATDLRLEAGGEPASVDALGFRLSPKVAVRVAEPVDAGRLAAEVGAVGVQGIPGVNGLKVFEAPDAGESVLTLHRRLLAAVGADNAWPLLARPRFPRARPNDPYLSRQWTLNNTRQTGGTVGADARVFAAWDAGFTGKGVLVSVVDDGFELTHPDLGASLRSDLGWDYRNDDPNPSAEGLDGFGEDGRPRADAHGTAVAGIVAAVANNAFGIAGIAYDARVVPVRALQRSMTDAQEASALGHRAAEIFVCNNSWGPIDDGKVIVSPGVLAEAARETGVRDGRNGRGIVYVWAAGNGAEQEDEANYDGYANSLYAVAVGALTDRGVRCTYSEKGACLTVSAPSGYDSVRRPGTWTTDLIGNRGYNSTSVEGDLSDNRFTSAFNGTSAAAPVVSAVVALMLEANPKLGWRDVKEILIRSASRTDSTNAGWFTNGAGWHFNHEYGAGAVNAGAAVTMAQGWTNLAPMARLHRARLTRDLLIIPDGDPTGVEHVFTFDGEFRVEQARLKVDITHPVRGELQVELVSPSGTVSRLWSPHSDANDDLRHRFLSVFHWGEPAVGEWKVRLVDFVPDQSGYLSGLELELFGTVPDPEVRLAVERAVTGGWELRLTGRLGATGILQRSEDLKGWTDVSAISLPEGTAVVMLPEVMNGAAWYRWVEKRD